MAPYLCKLPVPLIYTITAIETLVTLLGCYAIAVACGHVRRPWLPMISDCGIKSPEKYLFRLGIMLGSILMSGEMVLVYYSGKPYSKSKFSLVTATVGSFCLAVSAVISKKKCNRVHGGNLILKDRSKQI